MSDRHNGVAWRVPHKGGKAFADALSTGYLCAASPAGEAENGRRNWRRGSIPAERHLLGRGRGQERVQRCGYAAFCLPEQPEA